MKKIFLFMLIILLLPLQVRAAGRILFIPHDDRPISYHQTVATIACAGYEILLPPKELLSDTDELWNWLFKNAPLVNSAVIASDSMLYGGLIPSRKHDISQEVINSRLANFEELKKKQGPG